MIVINLKSWEDFLLFSFFNLIFLIKPTIMFKYVETFWCLSRFSFHYKWNKAWLLVINMVYTSCLTSCRTTWDLGFYEIRKYHQNLKNCRLVFSLPPKTKNTSKSLLKNRNWPFSRSALFDMETRVCLTCFVHDCSFVVTASDQCLFYDYHKSVRPTILV